MNEELATELRRRYDRDQAVRLAGADSSDSLEEVFACDRENVMWLRQVIRRHGWPGISLVGEAAENCAWVLAQHADKAITFQRQCLDLVIEAADAGEAPVWQVAYLTDRVLMHMSQAQRYATQYRRRHDDTWELLPVEQASGLDVRRRSIGLQEVDLSG